MIYKKYILFKRCTADLASRVYRSAAVTPRTGAPAAPWRARRPYGSRRPSVPRAPLRSSRISSSTRSTRCRASAAPASALSSAAAAASARFRSRSASAASSLARPRASSSCLRCVQRDQMSTEPGTNGPAAPQASRMRSFRSLAKRQRGRGVGRGSGEQRSLTSAPGPAAELPSRPLSWPIR